MKIIEVNLGIYIWVRVRGTWGNRGTQGYHMRIPHVSLYRSTQITSAINLLQPEEEQSTKEKRCNIWEELDSHNDVTVAAARAGKRDHSSMVATPILPNPKRLGAGMKGNIKR